jgi:hypothetical protein
VPVSIYDTSIMVFIRGLAWRAPRQPGSQCHPLKDETFTPGPAGLAQSIAADFSTQSVESGRFLDAPPFRKPTSVPMEGLLDSDVRIIENARDRAAPQRTHGGVGAMVIPDETHCLLECPSNTTLPPKIFNLKAAPKGRPSVAV